VFLNGVMCVFVDTIRGDGIKGGVGGGGGGGERENVCVCSCDVIVYGCTWCDMRVDNNAAVSNKCGCEWHWV